MEGKTQSRQKRESFGMGKKNKKLTNENRLLAILVEHRVFWLNVTMQALHRGPDYEEKHAGREAVDDKDVHWDHICQLDWQCELESCLPSSMLCQQSSRLPDYKQAQMALLPTAPNHKVRREYVTLKTGFKWKTSDRPVITDVRCARLLR